MSVTILVKRAAERELLRDIFEEWYRMDPKEARQTIKYIREVTSQDVHRSGKYRTDRGEGSNTGAGGHLKFRFPATLFWAIRQVIPRWGDDDADIRHLVEDMPDLMPPAMRRRIGMKK